MARPKRLQREKLLELLDPITPDAERDQQEETERLTLAGTLLVLAEINHEREYLFCRAVAEHLLGTVPEPDDAELEEE